MSLVTKTVEYLDKPGNNIAIIKAGRINEETNIFDFIEDVNRWAETEFNQRFIESKLDEPVKDSIVITPEIKHLPELAEFEGKNIIIVRDNENLTRSQKWKVVED